MGVVEQLASAEQEAPSPNLAFLQKTPSSTAINPSASPTSLAINENVFEVGPIRDLLGEIKREFANGRDWGLKPAVFHEMGVVTYSLLLYEKCDITETETSYILIYLLTLPLQVCISLACGSFLQLILEFILEFIPEFILEFILEFIFHLALTDKFMLSILFNVTVLLILIGYVFIIAFSKLINILLLECTINFGDLIARARRILIFVMSNNFWTHGHLKLRLNDHVYDYTWAAIGTKEFRALKLELRATECPIVPGVNKAQKGLLRYAFASLPMEFRSAEVRKRIIELSEAEHVGPSTEVRSSFR